MTTDQIVNEIRDLNMSYLILAQALIRADKAKALYRLGVSESVADLIVQMNPQQIVRVASRNLMLCTIRFDDELVWGLLTDNHDPRRGVEQTAGRLHASVLMAGYQPAQAMA